jgi:predicted dehydrogenase
MKIFLIGVGLIGKERLLALDSIREKRGTVEISGIYDPFFKDKKNIEDKFNVKFFESFEEIYKINPDWVFISTPHDIAVDYGKELLSKGFRVLIEKPLGRNLTEAQTLYDSAADKSKLWVGFNYRFFEGINSLLRDIRNNKFGRLISVNFILGHGCHPNITDGWKLDPVKAGGGCLIDPGIHFIDLARIMSNDKLKIKGGLCWDGFWKTGIEEECHLLFEGNKTVYNLQISIVKWRSTFRIEVNGEDGYAVINGRNRSYGKQSYIIGERWGWQKGKSQKDSEILINESDGEDVFLKETESLLFPDKGDIIRPCNAEEALENMRILEDCRKILNI